MGVENPEVSDDNMNNSCVKILYLRKWDRAIMK